MVAPQILIVDDDPCIRALISATLSRRGYEVRSAENGRAALALHAIAPADLVITDIFMPEMDGIEVIIALRSNVDIPQVVAISGGGSMCGKDALRMADLLGANAILEKPLSMSALVARVADLMDTRKSERAAGQRRRGLPRRLAA
jgi:two-component system response regulator MprA